MLQPYLFWLMFGALSKHMGQSARGEGILPRVLSQFLTS